MSTLEKLGSLLDTFAEVFEDKLGTFKSAKATITLQEGSQPQFRKARQVQYSLRPQVEEELKRLQSEGILSKVEWSDWSTPIVLVQCAFAVTSKELSTQYYKHNNILCLELKTFLPI